MKQMHTLKGGGQANERNSGETTDEVKPTTKDIRGGGPSIIKSEEDEKEWEDEYEYEFRPKNTEEKTGVTF